MLNDPETYRTLARQRERELIEEASRDRRAKIAGDHGGRSDTKRRGGR